MKGQRGLLSYKLSKTIPERKTALKKAKLYLNVPVKTAYLSHAEEMIRRHLNALQNDSWKVSKTFEKHADNFSFDDKALEKFPDHFPSESSIDELPLESEEWFSRMDALTFDNSEEIKAEQKRLKRGQKEKSRWRHNNRRNEGLADLANSNLLPSPWYLSLHPNCAKQEEAWTTKRLEEQVSRLCQSFSELKQNTSQSQPSGSAQTNSSDVASSTGINSVDDKFAFSF